MKKKATLHQEITPRSMFFGQYVRITMDMLISQSMEDGEERVTKTLPLGYDGVLLDEDDIYYFIGPDFHSISDMIRKDMVMSISVIEQKDELTELLENIPDGDMGEIN